MNEDLLYYIAVMWKQHVPDEQIKKNLLGIGWQEAVIDEAMAPGADMPKVQVELPQGEYPVNQGLKFLRTPLIILFSLLSITAALIFLGPRLARNNTDKNKKTPSEGIGTLEEEDKTGKVAAFLTSNNITESPYRVKVNFYDFSVKQLMPDIPELVIEDNSPVTLGQWSPDGRYITIQTHPVQDKCDGC